MIEPQLTVESVDINKLKPATYNPRAWSESAIAQLTDSIKRYGLVDPILVNGSKSRRNIVIGGHFRLKVAADLGYKQVPVVYLDIDNQKKEKELNLRLNRNLGDWDWDLLAEYDESLLQSVGFSSEEIDAVFDDAVDTPEVFDIEKELGKLDIKEVTVNKGDIWQLGDHTLLCGDSTIQKDFKRLMGDVKADMCMTDPPYILDYLNGKSKNGKPTEGFGYKKDRKYLETDVLPPDFSDKWMENVAASAKPDFSIIVYENWKNIPVIWEAMAKHWKIRNMLVWHLENRHQNFAAKHKFFNKHDIAMVGASGDIPFNLATEPGGLQEEYETALFATVGDPHWEGYKKDGKYVPTDFIEFRASDEQHSGQGVIFGTKPIEILIPYIKVLTKRDDVVIEPFGGSGSTLIACEKLKRQCFLMEKVPTYAQVIIARWEKLTGQKAVRVHEGKQVKDRSQEG